MSNNTQNTPPRQSNFELLRLLCMLMVLNLHSFSGYENGDGIIKAIDFFRNTTSICAVNTFILISGYFGIRWKFKSFFNLLFQLFFYSFTVYGVCLATNIIVYDKSDFIQCFKALYDNWNFITWYIFLWFVSPWLNSYSDNTDSKKLLVSIIVYWFAEILILRASTEAINFCVIYLIGRYIRKIGIVGNIKEKRVQPVPLYWFTTFLIFLITYLLNLTLHFDAKAMNNFILGYDYSSPLVILQAVFLFLIFGELELQSRIINWLAVSCLAVFLIHMHPVIKFIGYYSYTEELYTQPLMIHMTKLVILISLVFCGSILIDKIRILISDSLYKILIKISLFVLPLFNRHYAIDY